MDYPRSNDHMLTKPIPPLATGPSMSGPPHSIGAVHGHASRIYDATLVITMTNRDHS